MQRAKLFFFFGIWIAILPYLGFPYFLKNILFSLTGILLIYIGLVIKSKEPKAKKNNFDNFSENSWNIGREAKEENKGLMVVEVVEKIIIKD